MSNEHPIPKALRDRFDQIEDAICRNRMERDAVFTQMRTAVQAHFMSAGTAEVERLRTDLELTRLARQGDQIEIDGLKALCDGFRAQLADAAQSLETISHQAGRDEFMKDMTQIRGYANSRARVAQGALSANAEAASHGE